jgi:hypothetical protein
MTDKCPECRASKDHFEQMWMDVQKRSKRQGLSKYGAVSGLTFSVLTNQLLVNPDWSRTYS